MNCNISGLTEKEEDFKEQINEMIKKSCDKFDSMADIVELKAHFKKHHEEGTKAKHSVRLHLFSKIGDFVAEDTNWEILNALRESLRKLEVEFKRKKSRLA
jgi:ribosome-associated translation inhibitor RaiA